MTLGIGVLGTGRIAETGFLPAIAAAGGARPVAVLSRDQARGDAFAARLGIDRAYADLDALLADPKVDAVIVATPDAMHESQVIAAARAGKHILCEKPMGTTPEVCARMAEAVRASGVTFQMGYSNRFNSGLEKIKELIDAGRLGAVRHVRTLLTTPQSDPTEWRGAGEQSVYWAMSASGTHVIDAYRWFFGDPARVGGAMLGPVHHGPNDEISTVLLDYPGRLLAELTVAAILPKGGNRLEVHGEKGVIIADDVFGRVPRQEMTLDGEALDVAPADPFARQVAAFVAAVRDGTPPRAGLEDGVRNVEIMEAARTCPVLREV